MYYDLLLLIIIQIQKYIIHENSSNERKFVLMKHRRKVDKSEEMRHVKRQQILFHGRLVFSPKMYDIIDVSFL